MSRYPVYLTDSSVFAVFVLSNAGIMLRHDMRKLVKMGKKPHPDPIRLPAGKARYPGSGPTGSKKLT